MRLTGNLLTFLGFFSTSKRLLISPKCRKQRERYLLDLLELLSLLGALDHGKGFDNSLSRNHGKAQHR